MITFFGYILFSVALLAWGYQKLPLKVTRFVPLVLVIYLFIMASSATGLIDPSAEVAQTAKTTLANLLPAMIFLMMLNFRTDIFKKLGLKMVLAFFATTLSLITAFVALFYLLPFLHFEYAAQSLATLAGSWSGGTVNMIAVSSVVKLPASQLGSVIAVDTILYTLWVILLLSLVPYAHLFNRLTRAGTLLEFDDEDSCPISSSTQSYVRIIVLSVAVALGVNILSQLLPQGGFVSATFYSVILATLLGIAASFTRLRDLSGVQSVADAMLYLIIALIAYKASLAGVLSLGSFLLSAALILVTHALIMVTVAKLFRLDLFTIGVASLSHIGGIASAPILAGAYHRSLIPVGVAMATFGYLLGTVVGLLIAYLLGAL